MQRTIAITAEPATETRLAGHGVHCSECGHRVGGSTMKSGARELAAGHATWHARKEGKA